MQACSPDKPEKEPALTPAEGDSLLMAYAETFKLIRHQTYTEVTINEPWQGAAGPARYYLVPKGEPVPDHLGEEDVIRTPVSRTAVLSTSYLPMLNMLGVASTVRGFPDTSLISTRIYRQMASEGILYDLGQGTQIDRELLLQIEPEVVFGFGVGEPSSIERVLNAAGHRMVYNTDYLEKHPLGRAEWIKFFGAFYDKEALADSLFTTISERYDSLRQRATQNDPEPAVMASNLYGDTWYVPAGESWVATFIHDAGGRYLWKDTEGAGSLQMAFEPVLEKAQHADVWLNASNYTSLKDMAAADVRYTYFAPWKEGEVYNPLKSNGTANGNLYYELGYARPDLVLKDLILILQPDMAATGVNADTLTFYEKLP
ncbi:ABC transporter substrate-binding protein [Roseivirga sp. BDSF3-8]|uniref:ABC transporter substrate-binding protein n=1 Tax=Roseivirga sp. BDSF3-8 TaxID=3241598 RepID=UPI003531A469